MFSPTTATIAMVGIHGDVLDFFVRHVLREFLAQRFDGALGVRRGHDEADVVLRRRLRNQQHVRVHFRRGGESAAHHVRQAHDSRAAHGDQRHVANRGERFHAAAVGAAPCGVIFVPVRSGAKLLRIQTGIPACETACSVFGCSTFAPKYASSVASR